MPTGDLVVSRARAEDAPIVANLMQFYIHDFSELWFDRELEGELSPDGRYADYPGLETYWRDPTRAAESLLAIAPDEVTRARFRASDLRVETKPDLSPVSEADRAAEEVIRAYMVIGGRRRCQPRRRRGRGRW